MGQNIVAGLAIEIDRRTDLIELEVRTDTGYLEGAITAWIDAGGFIVVPENGGHGLFLY
jgi:hypothetical protein